jgi:hypothetical protein
MVITANVHVSGLIRGLGENGGKYSGGEIVTAGRGCGGGRSMGVLFVALYNNTTTQGVLVFDLLVCGFTILTLISALRIDSAEF